MTIKTEIELTHFMVPNFVLVKSKPGKREDGITPTPTIPLKDLSPDVLSKLCGEFRREVFAKAGKHDPLYDIPIFVDPKGNMK